MQEKYIIMSMCISHIDIYARIKLVQVIFYNSKQLHKIKDAILRTHTSASYCKQFSYNVQVMTWSTFREVLKRDFKDYLTRDQKFISIKNLLRMGIFLHPRITFIAFIHCFNEHSFKYLMMSFSYI